MKTIAKSLILRTPPTRLFHYTGQAGLVGIMRSNSIWASKIQGLNDRREFVHGCELACVVLKSLAPGKNGFESDLLDTVRDQMERVQNVNLCVCSFSEQGDVLSQWRAYAKDEQGYAIGFEGESLRVAGARERFVLGRCLYSDAEQRQVLEEHAADFWRNVPNMANSPTKTQLESLGSMFVNGIFEVVPFLKHKGFAEEREWRLASPLINYTSAGYSVRTGPRFPIPYYVIPLAWEGGTVETLDFVVGPGAAQQLAKECIMILVKESRLRWSNIYTSVIPLRRV